MKNDQDKLLLNLGCGSNYHPTWCNLDLVPRSNEVQKADLLRGVPFADGSAAAIYHSHVLEHLSHIEAKHFISECFRVLEPGGILRIAVPDLEQIAGQYLETIYRAWQEPTEHALANHHWMQLELMDQIVRRQSGGEMGEFMCDPEIANADFVQERLGYEFTRATQTGDGNRKSTKAARPGWLQKLKRKLIRLFFGKEFVAQLDEINFRQSGEIHKWMYDRVSLRQLLTAHGFVEFRVCCATESQIPDYASYELDARDGKTLKPDSIFVEAKKPAIANAAAA